jgi:hypothetical protein
MSDLWPYEMSEAEAEAAFYDDEPVEVEEPAAPEPEAEPTPEPPSVRFDLPPNLGSQVDLTEELSGLRRSLEGLEEPTTPEAAFRVETERDVLERRISEIEHALPFVGLSDDELRAEHLETRARFEDLAYEHQQVTMERGAGSVRGEALANDMSAAQEAQARIEAELERRQIARDVESAAGRFARQSLEQQYAAEDAAKLAAAKADPTKSPEALKIIEADTLRPYEQRRDYGERLATEHQRFAQDLQGTPESLRAPREVSDEEISKHRVLTFAEWRSLVDRDPKLADRLALAGKIIDLD